MDGLAPPALPDPLALAPAAAPAPGAAAAPGAAPAPGAARLRAEPPEAAPARQSDHAYRRLRDLIMRTELPPGRLLDEGPLAVQIGVGRTPLREALFRLAQDGLVDSVPRRGTFVAALSSDDLAALFEVRRELETLSARLAARRATVQHRRDLDQLIATAEALVAQSREDVGPGLALDEAFHMLVARATGNVHLVASVSRLYALSVRALYLARRPLARLEHEIGHYRAMAAALASGDADAAGAVMRAHLDIDPLALLHAAGGPTRAEGGL